MPRRPQPLRIAIDTGGTFTDCVWIERRPPSHAESLFHSRRSLPSHRRSPPQNRARRRRHPPPRHHRRHQHAARTQRRPHRARHHRRFEDAIEIGRQARPKLYDFFFDRIEPLVPKDLRFGVNERTASDGEILTAPTSEELRVLAEQLSAAKPQSIAISLLFSFANPKNEEAVAEALKPLAVPLSISHQILPEFREYERTSTVVINAYLQPVMQRYLENLEARSLAMSTPRVAAGASPAQVRATSPGLESARAAQRMSVAKDVAEEQRFGSVRATVRATVRAAVEERRFRAAKSPKQNRASAPVSQALPEADSRKPNPPRIFVMQSSGGITALSTAAREPVRTVLSGPAGGVVGAVTTARASGFDRIIAFDMGGTSTDVSLVEGEIKTATDAQIAGLPVSVPMLDIHTVGAGGGSLARFDAAGVLRVGPESAGADPGPICYGRGTAAHRDRRESSPRPPPAHALSRRRFHARSRPHPPRHARMAEEAESALSLDQFAAGVIRVVNATMEKAIRVVSIERGRDPRHFALVAFGGAGGLHACALAEALSIPHVIVPAFPGALSALGILASDVVKDYSRTVLWRVSGKIPADKLNREFAALEKTAAKDFREEAWQGSPHYHRSVDLRYRGQGYELNIPFTKNLLAISNKNTTAATATPTQPAKSN